MILSFCGSFAIYVVFVLQVRAHC
jgi:hypothetical protein